MKFLPTLSTPRTLHGTLALTLALALSASVTLQAAETGRAFATPEAAVAALASAVSTTNQTELRAIFGPAADDLVNPDPMQAASEFASFAAALSETNHLAPESDTRRILELGNAAWPFPVPIVQKDGRWFFDTAAGKEEIMNRRIGRNELATLKVVRAYVEAQREYASRRTATASGVLKYAQKIISTPGAKDGLFWPPDFDGEISPLGPLAADAAAEGYGKGKQAPGDEPQPFHGYFFKILTRQGKHAPGRQIRLHHQRKHDRRLRARGLARGIWRDRRHDVHREPARPRLSERPWPADGENRREDEGIRPGQDLDGLTRLNRLLATDHRLLITDY